MKEINITGAEYEIMKILWKEDKPLTSYEICDRLNDREWKYSTVSTLLSRLCEKGAVTYIKKVKSYFYSPLINESDYKIQQTNNLLTKMYGGSVKNLVASLFENDKISEQDIKELKQLFKL